MWQSRLETTRQWARSTYEEVLKLGGYDDRDSIGRQSTDRRWARREIHDDIPAPRTCRNILGWVKKNRSHGQARMSARGVEFEQRVGLQPPIVALQYHKVHR